jgi:hypothetical protein
MTLDASGNLGIGTTVINGYYGSSSVATRGVFSYTSSSTNYDTAPKGLVIRNDDTTTGNFSQLVFGSLNTGNTPIASASIWSINDARSSGFSTGSLAFGTVGGSGVISERARIDSSGNLLVGHTSNLSSGAKILVKGSVISTSSTFDNSSTGGAIAMFCDNANYGTIWALKNGNTAWGDVAIVPSGGNLLVGTTSNVGSARVNVSFSGPSNDGVDIIDASDGSGSQFIAFRNSSGTAIGTITRVTTTNAVTYNTTSDYRLKTVVGAVTGHGERIDALEPIEYTWKEDGTRTRGFLAHQFQEVYAQSVTGSKDEVDAEGNPKYQAMQASSSEVIADLVAEIQSLRKRLADAGI